WFTIRHVFNSSNPQTNAPNLAGFVSSETEADFELEVLPWPARKDGFDVFLRAFPWQHPIEVRVKRGRLKPGDTILMTYGDRRAGGPGVRLQPSQEPGFAMRVYVVPSAGSPLLPLASDLPLPIVGGHATRLVLIAPSHAAGGHSMPLLLRAEDQFGNQASGYEGDLILSTDDGVDLKRVSMRPSDLGVKEIAALPFRETGVIRFNMSDGKLTCRSNPTRVNTADDSEQIYFGDIHGHSVLSDGRGSPEEFYRYARDVAKLDFCALTDHDFMLPGVAWSEIQKATEDFNQADQFITIHAYEWSGEAAVGGDHNVYFRGADTNCFGVDHIMMCETNKHITAKRGMRTISSTCSISC
ncbi:MAG: hypothetical protein AAF709_10555, partial [Pseudomonadota bacterium]